MARGDLFKRDWRIRVGSSLGGEGFEYSRIDFDAKVEKSLKAEPNKCSLTLFNLAPDSRKLIESLSIYDPKRVRGTRTKGAAKTRAPKTGKIRVEIEAGYKDGPRSLIFRGDLRRALTKRAGSDVLTEIEGEDGGRSVLSSRVTESFPPGTRRIDVVKACAEAMGLGLGNLIEYAPDLQTVYTSGTTLDGQASEELKGVLRKAELTYSIQNGNLQFLRAGAGLLSRAFLVSPLTGLVGSPERDTTGMLIITTLLLPNIAPGAYLQLDSKDYKGVYRVVKIEYSLSSHGQDWYAKCECMPG